jgi:hypothetical protein
VRSNKRTALAKWLEEHKPPRINPDDLPQLKHRLAPISDGYLRRLLRDCGTPLDPLVEGVRQSSLDDLERTLLALLGRDRPAARRLVIEAKDRARFALRRLEGDAHAVKEEMILWMLTWLENPDAFPVWLRLRRKMEPQMDTDGHR